MAKGPGFLHYTGTRGGHGQPKKTQKAWSLRKGQNNLICPSCHVTCDRKDVKIWLDQNYGECPACFRKVHFDLHRPVGRPQLCRKEEVEFHLKPLNQDRPAIPIPEQADTVGMEPVETKPVEMEAQQVVVIPECQKNFSDYVERMKGIKNPCKYLTCDDITRLTSTPYRVVVAIKNKLKYKMYKGWRSNLTEMFRQAVLTAIHEGFNPPDLKHFKE